MNPTELANQVRDVDYGRLKAVLGEMKLNLEFSTVAMSELRQSIPKPAVVKKRTDTDLAFEQVRYRELALRNSIANASNAPAEVAAAAQAQVAADYEAYARAVAAAESIARNSGAQLAQSMPAE